MHFWRLCSNTMSRPIMALADINVQNNVKMMKTNTIDHATFKIET